VGYLCAVPRTRIRSAVVPARPRPCGSERRHNVWRAAVALACSALTGLSPTICQADEPPAPIRVGSVEVVRSRAVVLPALEAADVVERELAARAIALGAVDAAEVATLLEHTDWTLRHLALDALARTNASRVTLTRPHGNSLDRALRDPRVELQVAATRANGYVARFPGDAAPEVRLALTRELASNLSTHGVWPTPDGEVPAQLLAGNDGTAELAQRLAWTTGPSLESAWRVFPSLDFGAAAWLAAQPASALVPGAWTALAQDFAARCGGDPWATVVACYEECLAQNDWRRGPLAHVLRDLAATPAERAIAAALMAHVRPLTTGEAESFAAGASHVCARFGTDEAARVLLPAARLVPPGLAAALQQTLPDAAADVRELLTRCTAEALGPTALTDLTLDADPELLVACAHVALVRGGTIAGDRLARFADHAQSDVRETLFTLVCDALSSGRAAMAVPMLERLLTDPDPDLAAAAFRALASVDVSPETEAHLYRVWRALPDEATRRAWLRDLSRTTRWSSFMDDLLQLAAGAHATEFVELLGPLADEPRVGGALVSWFYEDIAVLCALHEFQPRLVLDGRAAGLAKALHQARALRPELDLTATFERALVATMHAMHPSGQSSRAKLPKTLVSFLGVDEAGRAALERVLVATDPRAPRRVRTEAAIVLAERIGRQREAARVDVGNVDAQSVLRRGPLGRAGSAALDDALGDALGDAATESEAELAVRAIRAFMVLPRPARGAGVGRLLAQWDALDVESVRIAVVDVAAEEPAHYAALQRIVEGASDDTVAGALIEAMAASEHGRAESLVALARFDTMLDGATGLGDSEDSAERGARGLSPKLTDEQALVRREAVLLGFARAQAPVPDEVAARLFARPRALSRSDLRAAFHGEQVASAEFRFRGELAIGEALARERRLGASLVLSSHVSLMGLSEAHAGAPPAEWWEVDADFLAALARRAAPHEPAAGGALAEAALVAHMGLPEARREREGRATRTELLALWLAAETAAGMQRDASTDSPARAKVRAAHLERAADVAGELVAGLALTNLERGFGARDPRGLDLRTIERLFGATDPSLGVDPRARLNAAVHQLHLLALLELEDLNGFAWAGIHGRGPDGRADWLARSREARALEDRIDARHAALKDERANEAARERHPDRERR